MLLNKNRFFKSQRSEREKRFMIQFSNIQHGLPFVLLGSYYKLDSTCTFNSTLI